MKKHSADFQRMMQLIHDEGAKLQEVSLQVKEDHEHVKMTFLKGEETITIESKEWDICGYAWHFQQSCDASGNGQFSVVTNLSPYFDDIMPLVPDKKKLDLALLKLIKGKSNVTDETIKIVDDFVFSTKQHSLDFKQLRDDYTDIVAFAVMRRAHMNEVIAKAKKNHPKYEAYANLVNQILSEASALGGNPLANYIEYKKVVRLEITNKLVFQSNSQRHRMERTMMVVAKANPIAGDVGTDIILKFYADMAELCSSPIEALRNCIQRCKEGAPPEERRSFNDDCDYIAKDERFAILVDHLKPSIRNAVAHVSYEIDHEKKVAILHDERRKIEMSYEEVAAVSHELRCLIAPMLLCLERHKYHMICQLMDSREFRLLLMKIGHQKFPA